MSLVLFATGVTRITLAVFNLRGAPNAARRVGARPIVSPEGTDTRPMNTWPDSAIIWVIDTHGAVEQLSCREDVFGDSGGRKPVVDTDSTLRAKFPLDADG